MSLVLTILIFLSSFAAQASSEQTEYIDVSTHLDYLVDATGTHSIEDIIRTSDAAWSNTQEKAVNFGFRKEVFWFRIALPQCNDRRRILEIAYPLLDFITIWFVKGSSIISSNASGDRLPFSNRPVEHLTFGFPYECHAVDQAIIRIESSSAVQLPLRVWDEPVFNRSSAKLENAHMLYFGSILIMAIYNIFIFISVRKISYLFYVLFVLTFATFQAGITGMGFRYVWPSMPIINDYVIDKSINGLVIFGTLFTFFFLKVWEFSPRLFRNAIVVLSLFGVFTLISFSLPYSIGIRISIISVILSVGVQFTSLIKSLVLKKREGYFYGVAWSTLLLGALVLAANKLGVLPRNVLTENSLQLSSVMEMLLLSFALADQTNVLRRNLGVANRKLTETLQSIERIVGEKTQSIRSIMETMKQGIITVKGQDLIVEPDYSTHASAMLDRDQLKGQKLQDIFINHLLLGDDARQQILSALQTSMDDDIVNFEMNSYHLPQEVRIQCVIGMRDMVVDWVPMTDDSGKIVRILVSFRDVTEVNQLHRDREKHTVMLDRLQQLLNTDLRNLRSFFERALALIQEQNRVSLKEGLQSEDVRKIFVAVHTLKGESRSFGLGEISDACHRVEEQLEDARCAADGYDQGQLSRELHKLQQVTQEYHELFQEKIGRVFLASELIIDENKLRKWESRIRLMHEKNADPSEVLGPMLHDIYQIVHIERKTYQEKIQRWARRIAFETNYPEPLIEFKGFVQYLSKDASELLDSCLVHLIQNSVAHGFESGEERMKLGKPSTGTLTLAFQKSLEGVFISIYDDGRGLNLRAIEAIALKRGLVKTGEPMTAKMIENCLFMSGFSSAANVSKVAGRGVGLDALRDFVLKAGGKISVEMGTELDGYCSFAIILDLPGDLFPDIGSLGKLAA